MPSSAATLKETLVSFVNTLIYISSGRLKLCDFLFILQWRVCSILQRWQRPIHIFKLQFKSCVPIMQTICIPMVMASLHLWSKTYASPLNKSILSLEFVYRFLELKLKTAGRNDCLITQRECWFECNLRDCMGSCFPPWFQLWKWPFLYYYLILLGCERPIPSYTWGNDRILYTENRSFCNGFGATTSGIV